MAYPSKFKQRVIEYVRAGHSPAMAVREFPGPCVATVYLWLGYRPKNIAAGNPAVRVNASGVIRAFAPSYEVRERIVLRCAELGEHPTDVACRTGYPLTSIYNWIRQHKRGGVGGRWTGHDIQGNPMATGTISGRVMAGRPVPRKATGIAADSLKGICGARWPTCRWRSIFSRRCWD